ncbi:MAG: excinuclease ABC subunit UvrC [Candidatus Omnitrophica bacterium]|nr:excinuclease ABC subunit UvrC [Candidatus Omnitrophota bacterium]
MKKNKDLRIKIKSAPDSPGVYTFKDKDGNIIYIGKATSLKKRVYSYFNRPLDAKTQAMTEKIADVDFCVAPTERQARILEAALIKERQPQYNIDLKDDKSFPFIKITNEKFPRVEICRNRGYKTDSSARYFGPYTNAKLLRQAFKMIRGIFGFRSCPVMPDKPCLYYRLKLCPAPCAGMVSAGEYGKVIKNVEMFLESRYEDLRESLMKEMRDASAEKRFEDAARIRDRIAALRSIENDHIPFSAATELADLQKSLVLKKIPERIEAFDISNISGTNATGSMVSFYKGAPDKNNYRRFRIKTISGIDDYAMMREVVHRRYLRLKTEKSSLPDLVLIDGGRQHLNAAETEIRRLGLNIPLISIAKEYENIYMSGRKFPVKFDSDTPALNLIRRIRDEAHRFALKYHHFLRKKKAFENA